MNQKINCHDEMPSGKMSRTIGGDPNKRLREVMYKSSERKSLDKLHANIYLYENYCGHILDQQ